MHKWVMVAVSAFFAGEGREAYEMKKAVQIGRRSREKTPDKMFRGLEPIARKHKSRVSVVTETYVSTVPVYIYCPGNFCASYA